MLRDITIGQYLNVDSVVHRLDPRSKFLSLNIFMITLFMMPSIYSYIPVALMLGATIYAAKIPFSKILKGLKPVMFLLVIAFVLNIFMIEGEGDPLFHYGIFRVYMDGIRRATYMALRLILLVVGTSVLTLTTSPIEMTDAVEYLLKPLKVIKVPAHEIAMMMTIALRFIPTLLNETDKIMKAQMSRGADFETGSIFKRAKAMVPLFIPLFVSAFRRADDLAVAMEARCYRGGVGRTRMKILKFSPRDYMVMLAISLIMLLSYYVGVLYPL
ncbi:MAG: energy-coupling factor transporter transmembrane component T [Bacillota bacterium]|nr:energy-coupling factor transporter transmembrane component T [Bacillota bacterium]